jgi:hypothetical protein
VATSECVLDVEVMYPRSEMPGAAQFDLKVGVAACLPQ